MNINDVNNHGTLTSQLMFFLVHGRSLLCCRPSAFKAQLTLPELASKGTMVIYIINIHVVGLAFIDGMASAQTISKIIFAVL